MKTNRIKKLSVLIAVAMILIVAFASIFQHKLTNILTEQVEDSIIRISEKNAKIVTEKIDSDFKYMSGIAKALEENTPEECSRILNAAKDDRYLYMGIIARDGSIIAGDNVALNNYEIIQKAMDGYESIQYAKDFPGGNCILMAVPSNSGVIYSAISKDEFTQTINKIIPDDLFEFTIFNRDHDAVMSFTQDNSRERIKEFFSNVNQKETDIVNEKIVDSMLMGKAVTIPVTSNKDTRYVTCSRINDLWYLVSIVPQNLVISHIRYGVTMSLSIFVFLLIAIALVFVYLEFLREKNSKQVYDLAYTDSLTGIDNWERMKTEAQYVLNSRNAYMGGDQYYYVSIDINNFRMLNDIFGRGSGDEILKYCAKCVSEAIGKDELCCRKNSDEFDLLLKARNNSAVKLRLENLIAKIADLPEEKSVSVNVVCGVRPIVLPLKRKFLTIVDEAEIVRKNLKKSSGSGIAFFNDEIRQTIIEERMMESEMENALLTGQFEVYIQPKYELENEKIAGGEALIRWNHPKLGLIPPFRFIPMFEESGNIDKLDRYVLEKVCRMLRERLDAGQNVVPISVNLSRVELANNLLVEELEEISDKYKIPRELIEFELTESVSFEDTNRLINVISKLKDSGFLVSMDDFGTGYSSLSLLTSLNLDMLKIDRGFIVSLGENAENSKAQSLVRDIINMSLHLNIRPLAEGVETEKQKEFLSSSGCEYIQGYYYAKPMPMADFELELAKD